MSGFSTITAGQRRPDPGEIMSYEEWLGSGRTKIHDLTEDEMSRLRRAGFVQGEGGDMRLPETFAVTPNQDPWRQVYDIYRFRQRKDLNAYNQQQHQAEMVRSRQQMRAGQMGMGAASPFRGLAKVNSVRGMMLTGGAMTGPTPQQTGMNRPMWGFSGFGNVGFGTNPLLGGAYWQSPWMTDPMWQPAWL